MLLKKLEEMAARYEEVNLMVQDADLIKGRPSRVRRRQERHRRVRRREPEPKVRLPGREPLREPSRRSQPIGSDDS